MNTALLTIDRDLIRRMKTRFSEFEYPLNTFEGDLNAQASSASKIALDIVIVDAEDDPVNTLELCIRLRDAMPLLEIIVLYSTETLNPNSQTFRNPGFEFISKSSSGKSLVEVAESAYRKKCRYEKRLALLTAESPKSTKSEKR